MEMILSCVSHLTSHIAYVQSLRTTETKDTENKSEKIKKQI